MSQLFAHAALRQTTGLLVLFAGEAGLPATISIAETTPLENQWQVGPLAVGTKRRDKMQRLLERRQHVTRRD